MRVFHAGGLGLAPNNEVAFVVRVRIIRRARVTKVNQTAFGQRLRQLCLVPRVGAAEELGERDWAVASSIRRGRIFLVRAEVR